MSRYRVETVHGRHLLCGGVIPDHMVKTGQRWASADGSNREVQVTSADTEWVGYTWSEGEKSIHHEKLNFAFQCRYCLVLDEPVVPEELS